jgi:hypothetical protein
VTYHTADTETADTDTDLGMHAVSGKKRLNKNVNISCIISGMALGNCFITSVLSKIITWAVCLQCSKAEAQ